MSASTEKSGKPRRSFQEELAHLKNHKDRLALPRPSLAMWPGDLEFWTDLSDPSRFNEQYIETHYMVESTVSDAYMISTWHTIVLVATIAAYLSDRGISLLALSVELVVLGLLSVFLLAIKMPTGRIRFNRRAQLVHFFYKKKVISIPWRNAYPFAKIVQLGSVDLGIYFPTAGSCNQQVNSEIIHVQGNFDVGEASLGSAFHRFEFIRRYMEDGLAAVAPPLHPSPGFEPRKVSGYFRKSVDIFYYAGFGFLIDRWAACCNARFRWPEEIERLCRADADLAGYDTTPVVTSRTLFYRFDLRQGGYYLCDAQGQERRDATIAERAATYPTGIAG